MDGSEHEEIVVVAGDEPLCSVCESGVNEFVVVWVREKVWLASVGGISTQFAEALASWRSSWRVSLLT